MRKFLLTAQFNLLSRFSVKTVRKHLQRSVAKNAAPASIGRERQLLVDVSVIIRHDGRTGIQRVVRALLLQLLKYPPKGWRVRPVFATRKQHYCYAPDDFGLLDVPASSMTGADAIKVEAGDLFLGLDLAAHLFPLHKLQMAQWKNLGVEISILVYDLLPITHPEWFTAKTSKNFYRWLKTIAIFADGIICISNAVKAELEECLYQKYALAQGDIPIGIIPLGADIESSAPSRGLPANVNALMACFSSKPTVLMVGTIEPRKGHRQVIAAFETLWQKGRDINLVFVGKPGWHTESLQKYLHVHPQKNNHFCWLDNTSDELLELLYVACAGVIVASKAEGFCLPMIEAMHYNKPVLARDIPVLREKATELATYFSNDDAEILGGEIEAWLTKIGLQRKILQPGESIQVTWHDSAQQLLTHMKVLKVDASL